MNEHDERPANDARGERSRNATGDDAEWTSSVDEERLSPLGAVFKRAAACFYDILLLVAVLFVVTALLLVANDGEAFGPLYLVVAFAVGWLFFDWFWRHGGQTLGMRAWRLKLVDDGDVPLTRARTFVRYTLGCVLFGVTYVSVPFDERRRAMHDRLTRTRVVRAPKEAKRS